MATIWWLQRQKTRALKWALTLMGFAQGGAYLLRVGLVELHVVAIRKGPATGQYATASVIAHRLEFPDGTNALEVTHMRAVALVHAVHMAVDLAQRERCQGGLSG